MVKNQQFQGIKRWFRQLIFIPYFANRWLTDDSKHHLAKAIQQAERHHQGEIVLIIENQLPLFKAYHQNCYQRAIELFAKYHVWDTQHNTGVLIYLNLCERDLQIVADRGIHQKVHHDCWQRFCQTTITTLQTGEMVLGLCQLIEHVGQLLKNHYPSIDSKGDELSNEPIHL